MVLYMWGRAFECQCTSCYIRVILRNNQYGFIRQQFWVMDNEYPSRQILASYSQGATANFSCPHFCSRFVHIPRTMQSLRNLL